MTGAGTTAVGIADGFAGCFGGADGPAADVGLDGTEMVRVDENEVDSSSEELEAGRGIGLALELLPEPTAGAPKGMGGGPKAAPPNGKGSVPGLTPPHGLGGLGGGFSPPSGDEEPLPSHVAALNAADDAASTNGDFVNWQAKANSLSWRLVLSSSPKFESSQDLQAQAFA